MITIILNVKMMYFIVFTPYYVLLDNTLEFFYKN